MNAIAEPLTLPSDADRRTVRQHWLERIAYASARPHENECLFDALSKLAERRPVKVANIFYWFKESENDWSTTRRLVKSIADDCDHGMVLFEFDRMIGRYRTMQLAYPRTFRPWIASFQAYADWDDIDEELSEDFVRCEDCHEYEVSSETHSTYHDDSATICRTCISNEYVYSDYYDAYVYCDDSREALDANGDQVTIHYEDDDFYFNDDEDCYVHHNYGPKIIGAYHSSKNFFQEIHSNWTNLHKRWMGVELEVECKDDEPSDVAENINSLVNGGTVGKHCFFERDGSLSNGFEIITQPMGLDEHTKFWDWLKNKDVTRPLLSHKTSTCGLHVHVTRRSLSKLQLAKMVTFVNSNDNRDLIEAISRRYSASHCRITDKKLGTAYKINNERYEAVNLQPRRTVEFRIFRGTLKYESLMSAIEFVNALVEYCSDQSGYGFDLRSDSFLKFINTPAMLADTKHLRVYLDNRLNQD